MVTRSFNAVSVELFLRMHGYSEVTHGGLIKKSTTPTALTRLFHDVINIYMRINKWWIMPKRYNTYSVVPHT